MCDTYADISSTTHIHMQSSEGTRQPGRGKKKYEYVSGGGNMTDACSRTRVRLPPTWLPQPWAEASDLSAILPNI